MELRLQILIQRKNEPEENASTEIHRHPNWAHQNDVQEESERDGDETPALFLGQEGRNGGGRFYPTNVHEWDEQMSWEEYEREVTNDEFRPRFLT